jgi:phospho-N-acetylmuramoyl-pentapeptide-transferase
VISFLVVVFIIGGPLIKIFSENMISGPIRQDGPIDHIIKKSGTPTMGGVIIIIGMLTSTLLWADLTNIYIWTLIFVSLSLGLLGFTDDLLKIRLKNSRGLNSKLKFFGQLIIASIALLIIIKFSNHEYLYNLYFPFFKNLIWQMGLFFIPFGLFVIIGSSNAVNLTDGLDGLATVPVMLVALSFTLISYVVGNTIFSEYLQLQYIPDVGELSIFCGSIVGSCLGFLWYNAPPAKNLYGRYWLFIFKVGSLSSG